MDVSVDLASRTSGYACLLVDLPLFRRWVRENDQEAVDLLGAFLVWFDKACVHPPEAHALLVSRHAILSSPGRCVAS